MLLPPGQQSYYLGRGSSHSFINQYKFLQYVFVSYDSNDVNENPEFDCGNCFQEKYLLFIYVKFFSGKISIIYIRKILLKQLCQHQGFIH